MSLVDTNMKWSLSSLVSGIDITTSTMEKFNHCSFITKCCMMHRSVTILVLKEERNTKCNMAIMSEVLYCIP